MATVTVKELSPDEFVRLRGELRSANLLQPGARLFLRRIEQGNEPATVELLVAVPGDMDEGHPVWRPL